MADLNVTVDLTDVQKLQAALDLLGPAFGKAVARIQRESKQMEAATKASANVIKQALDQVTGAAAQRDLEQWGAAQKRRLSLMAESEKIAQRQAAAEQKVTQELIRQSSAAEELARANAQRVQSQIGGNLGLGAQGISAGASASAFEAEIERLRSKYDQVYASSQLYERSLNELDAAHRLGAISTLAHTKAVDQLNLEYQQFQSGAVAGMNRFATAQTQSALGMSRMGVVTQQAGYQIGDFLVQVQSGTNWMVAFGQQATQLAGLMTTFGGKFIGIGTALGIIIPLATALGAAWMRTSGEVAGDKRIEETLKKIQDETITLQEKWDNLKFGSLVVSEIDTLSAKASELRAEIEALTLAAEADILRPLVNTYGPAIVAAQEQLDLTVARLNKLEEEKRKQSELNAQLAVAEQINVRMIGLNDAILMAMAKQEGAIKRGADRLAEGERYSQSIKTILESIGGMQLNVGLNIQAKVSGLPDFAVGLWDKLGALGASAGEGFMSSSPRPRAAPNDIDFGLPEVSGGGGGGGGSDPFTQRFEELQQFLQSESELELETYTERQSTLQTALDRKLITIQEYNDMERELKQEHNKVMEELDVYRYGSGLAQAETFFGGMADAFAKGNDKMRKTSQVFAGIEATINAYRAFNQVLADPSLPFFAKIPAAISVLAAGMQTVQAIKGGGSGGGGGGSVSRGSSTVPTQAAAPTPQTVYIDSLDPAGLYSGQTLINLFDALYDENSKRGRIFVVAS